MKPKIFIDGSEGTTGLKIYDRFKNRDDIILLTIDPLKRKDPAERQKLINQSDVTFLCLPDDAARESVSLLEKENNHTRIIDTSTAHRTALGWSYGFPELSPAHRQAIKNGRRIAVPGCYATGFIALVYPLIKAGIMPRDYPVTVHAVSGYSGAGKKMIAAYEDKERETQYDAPRFYALGQQHKHLKEMRQISGLDKTPIFNPIIADYYQGMVVSLPLYASHLRTHTSPRELAAFFADYYAAEKFIRVMPAYNDETADKFITCNASAGWDGLNIYPVGNDERIVLMAQLDNLGKGASGAAIQCLNLMLGADEDTGLVL